MALKAEFDWNDLRYFLHAAQAKSLAGAARGLGVQHSTVGRRLSALEHALGVLVLRHPDGLQLTRLGKRLLPLVEQVERAVATVKEQALTQKAVVTLAVPSGFAPLFAAALTRPRRQPLPFSLAILSGARPVDLSKGEADLAIRAGGVADPDLISSRLCSSAFALYAADTYVARHPDPIDPGDLRGHDIVGYDASLSSAPPARWLEAHATGARIVLRNREMTDVLSAALSGVGLAVLPCLLGDQESALKRLTPQAIATQDLFVVHRREVRISDPVRAAIRFVRSVVKQRAASISGERQARAG